VKRPGLRSKAVSESNARGSHRAGECPRGGTQRTRGRGWPSRVSPRRTRNQEPGWTAIVERRLISVGDFVSPGTRWSRSWAGPDTRLAALPEPLSGQLGPGSPSRSNSPSRPGSRWPARSPRCGRMVRHQQPRGRSGSWEPAGRHRLAPGGSVTARVVLVLPRRVVVPAGSVVRARRRRRVRACRTTRPSNASHRRHPHRPGGRDPVRPRGRRDGRGLGRRFPDRRRAGDRACAGHGGTPSHEAGRTVRPAARARLMASRGVRAVRPGGLRPHRRRSLPARRFPRHLDHDVLPAPTPTSSTRASPNIIEPRSTASPASTTSSHARARACRT